MVKRAAHLLFIVAFCGAGVMATAQTCQPLSPDWEYVADRVMGGVSTGQIAAAKVDGKDAILMTGAVSLENNGGFIQMAFDPAPSASALDASGYSGISLEVRGNGETYALNLRTSELMRPWQSYRADFIASAEWTRITLPFDAFQPSNTSTPLNPALLRRIGVIAVGRAFDVDIAVTGLCLVK